MISPEPNPDRPSAADGAPSTPLLRLVGCSPDRTLIAMTGGDGRWQLVKLFERGSMDEAVSEAAIGALARIPGVVRYREARRDPSTGRPSVVLDYHPGVDVAQWIARHGPLAPRTAARIGARLAATLAALHALSHRDAPHGIVHRDVKPSNVFLVGRAEDEMAPDTADVLLLDFEHAVPVAPPTTARDAGPRTRSGDGEPFSGGTHGYAPPEAYAGATPGPPFDVFGFGATLLEILTGRPPFRGDPGRIADAIRSGTRRDRRGLPEPLSALISGCLETAPDRRPSMREVVTALEALAAQSDRTERDLDGVLAALQREDLAEVSRLLAVLDPSAAPQRHGDLLRMQARAVRLIERCGRLPALPPARGARDLAGALAEAVPRLRAWLVRFPASPRALALVDRVHFAFAELLEAAPREVAAAKRDAAFDEAESLLELTLRAARAVEHLPRHQQGTPGSGRDPRMPGPLERDPVRYLTLALKDVREAARTHAALLEQLHGAEAELDLCEVERVLGSAAALYSGASSVVAGLKDRAHRLRFYVERIGQPVRGLDELGEQLATAQIAADLAPLLELQATCARRVAEQGPTDELDSPGTRGGTVRVLQQMLHDLVDEFPHVQQIAARADTVLDSAMAALTDRCWALLEDANKKLRAEPIPVRPLQSIVHRIDALRLLAVLVDRPQRARADLLDAHERLRLEVDQARAARDRLARGAEAAMERGHLTTALYDMKRAVDRFSDEPGEIEGGGHRLIAKLEQARRKKNAIDQAAAKNMRLATRYADLQDDPKSQHKVRLATLVERQRVLRFLVGNLQEERVGPYRNDLRNVAAAIAQERGEHAEAELDRTVDLEDRERIARRTVQHLSADARDGVELGGRVLRILQHWQRHLERERHQLRERDARREKEQQRRQRRRRVQQGVALGLALLASAAALHFTGVVGRRDPIAALAAELTPRLEAPFVPKTGAGRPEFEAVDACIALDQFVVRLEGAENRGELAAEPQVAPLARRLVGLVNDAVDSGPSQSREHWAVEFSAAVLQFETGAQRLTAELPDGTARAELARHLSRFSTRVQEAGWLIASLGAATADDKRAMQAAIERLAAGGGAAPSSDAAAAIRSLLQ